MEHCWLLTWSTYGTWVPDAARGGTGEVAAAGRRAARGHGTAEMPERSFVDPRERAAAARRMLAEPPASFSRRDAEMVVVEFRETARIRRWRIFAGAVTPTRVHLVVGVADDPPASGLLRDFKSYASRALNADRGFRRRWWTRSGSTRPLRVEGQILAAIEWVQKCPETIARIADTGEPQEPAARATERQSDGEGERRR
ncbi:MAG: hypothetical protein O3B31_09625 [Chloroflexi bacterium]|nr:hypothetical protein [Chloroflexota bacterium]